MSDSCFAVHVFLASVILGGLTGALAAFLYLSGPHECQVEVQYTSHKVVYLTQCKIGDF